mmetsp:Transcript_3162/g.9677  ORF Transcript_3162/g.9677 Transcript_3162/m.9677 type:complete len:130 (+) Transcript_3162:272-661(+)
MQTQHFEYIASKGPSNATKKEEISRSIAQMVLEPGASLKLDHSIEIAPSFRACRKQYPARKSGAGVVLPQEAVSHASSGVFDPVVTEVVQLTSGDPLVRFRQSSAKQRLWTRFLGKEIETARKLWRLVS